jgi:hypothetical protein
MMGNPPFSVNDFFIEVRRLEDIVDSLAGSTEKEDVKKTANDSLFQAVEALTNQVAFILQYSFPSKKNWRSLDGNILAVVGETNFIVRYSGETIDLKQVLVMENVAYPVVLGMDWIVKAGAVIYVKDERPVVNVSKN